MKNWIVSLLAYNDGMVMSGRYLPEPTWTPSEKFNSSRLDQQQRSATEPRALGSVIGFNESYMDVVDWAHRIVGPAEIIWAFVMLFPFASAMRLTRSFIEDPWPDDLYIGAILVLIFVQIMALPFLLWFGRVLYYTFTGCTHYPVRLDRRNQMVHVFRHNGEGGVSSYHWKDIIFGLIGGGARQRGFLTGAMTGCIQRPDGGYDYFRLGGMWPSDESMYGQWEYFRRYMENGPGSIPEPESCCRLTESGSHSA